jgi:hypothetical protein
MRVAGHVEITLRGARCLLIPVGADVVGGVCCVFGGVVLVFQLFDESVVGIARHFEITLRGAQGVLLTRRTEGYGGFKGGCLYPACGDTAGRQEHDGGEGSEMLLCSWYGNVAPSRWQPERYPNAVGRLAVRRSWARGDGARSTVNTSEVERPVIREEWN